MNNKTFSIRTLTALAAVAFVVGACQTSPTGRKQLVLLPEGQMDTMGAQAFSEMKSKQQVERDPATNAYVKCVADAITRAMGENRQWEVVVFKEDSANAFALPGGKIGVHTGLLKVAQTPDQLAAVIGHEVGHVIAQHGNERVSQSLATQGGLVAASVALKDRTGKSYDLVMAGLGLGAQFGVLLPFSRTQESEADIIGLDLMAKAGYDPHQSVELWKNMAKAAGGAAPPEFLSTHPAPESRIANLESHMGEAESKRRTASAASSCRRG